MSKSTPFWVNLNAEFLRNIDPEEAMNSYTEAYDSYLRICSRWKTIGVDEFHCLRAFTWSWIVGTLNRSGASQKSNPDIALYEEGLSQSLALLNELYVGKEATLDDLRLLGKSHNNSIAYISKSLHFLMPTRYGILDDRVFIAGTGTRPTWKRPLARTNRQNPFLRGENGFRQYIEYTPKLREVAASLGCSIREVEVRLFNLGGCRALGKLA